MTTPYRDRYRNQEWVQCASSSARRTPSQIELSVNSVTYVFVKDVNCYANSYGTGARIDGFKTARFLGVSLFVVPLAYRFRSLFAFWLGLQPLLDLLTIGLATYLWLAL